MAQGCPQGESAVVWYDLMCPAAARMGGHAAWCGQTVQQLTLILPRHLTLIPLQRILCVLPQMMAMAGGKERTVGEWQHLLAGGGFSLERLVPLSSGFSMIVAAPAAEA